MKLPRVMGFQRGLAPFGGVQRQSLWAGPGGSPAEDSKGGSAPFGEVREMKCVIFAGRPVSKGLRAWWKDADCIIAADAGWEHTRRLGLAPDLFLGDFDSAALPPEGAVLALPAEKDDTDTHFAAREALRRGSAEVVILGGLGGRLDHTLANCQTLRFLAENGVRAVLADEENEVMALVPGTYTFPRREGWYLSVFSAGEAAEGVTLEGVKYPLRDYTLTNSFPIGVSNEFAEEEAVVRFSRGSLLLVFSRMEKKA